MEKKTVIVIVLLIIVLIGLGASAYSIYFYMNKCDTKECFNKALVDCKRSDFTSETTDTSTQYRIIGKVGESCQVYVKLLQVKQGSAELAVLENQDMNCFTPLEILTDPEKDLKSCHGSLKEEIQNIIIQRLHSQIVENLGKINNETTNIL